MLDDTDRAPARPSTYILVVTVLITVTQLNVDRPRAIVTQFLPLGSALTESCFVTVQIGSEARKSAKRPKQNDRRALVVGRLLAVRNSVICGHLPPLSSVNSIRIIPGPAALRRLWSTDRCYASTLLRHMAKLRRLTVLHLLIMQ
jgi:hypothetical protein